MKVALYSVTYSAAWYRGNPIYLEDLIPKAKAFGYDGLEIGAKRPHASPLDLDEPKCEKLRKLAEKTGIEIAALGTYSNFISPIIEQRENELLKIREDIKIASYLGTKIVRVFAAWAGVTMRNGLASYDLTRRYSAHTYPGLTRIEQWNWCKEGLKEAVEYAEKYGIILALQNHLPLIENHRDMLEMIQEVNSEGLKACLDAPLLTSQDDNFVREAVQSVKGLQIHTHFGGEYERRVDGKVIQRQHRFDRPLTNYETFVKALKEIGYEGYLCYELCHPFLPKNHEYGSIAEVDEQAQLALEYMRGILKQASHKIH